MNIEEQIVVFVIDNSKYALNLSNVERVIPSVAITKLPEAPAIIEGIIKIGEQIIPIVNTRKRFHIAERKINIFDKIIIVRTKKRIIGLIVDNVEGAIELGGRKPVPAEKILPKLKLISGVIQLDDGLVLIHDVDEFLSLDEDKKLTKALEK
ncbi:chemotaxis protein CheW [Melioribacteraceae bacterium 4301-Me]|uniref:chemotaxis protein CheW n=1 Tax=Pyranulibacter aquaticus TaxID=3163344 RepID=UPI00359AF8F4